MYLLCKLVTVVNDSLHGERELLDLLSYLLHITFLVIDNTLEKLWENGIQDS